jgi:hypothetical protein
MLAAALPVAAVGSLIGMMPHYAEDAHGNLIKCGPTRFYVGRRPSPWCNVDFDLWRLIAEVGLYVATGLVVAAIMLGIRSAVAQRRSTAGMPSPSPEYGP